MTITTPSKELHVIPPLYKTPFQPTKDEHTHTEVRWGWGGEVATIGPGQRGIHPAMKGPLEKEKILGKYKKLRSTQEKDLSYFLK